MQEPHDLDQPTPKLDKLLQRLRARVTAHVWSFGLGTATLVLAAWLSFAFLADWFLHLPAAVRVIDLVLLLALPAWCAWRVLVRPLQRVPDRAGLAVVLERARPELRQLLVSAVELRQRPPSDAAGRALAASVLRRAEERSGELALGNALDGVLEPARPRRRAAFGALAALACIALFATNPVEARVFWARIAGGATPWPQRTHLSLEIPLAAEAGAEAARESGTLRVRVARGSDVPVIVRARGEAPDEVSLHFDDGQVLVLGASGGDVFRTNLRAVQADRSFHVTGGDDRDGDPRAELTVLTPPDVAGVALAIEPPAYSGLPARLEFDKDVEVLAGSRLRVHVLTAPETATGRARLLPMDRALELESAPYPAAPAANGVASSDERRGLVFELIAEQSIRFRFELKDDTGLENPDPGLFAVTVVEDKAPEVELLSPSRGDVDTVLGGLLSLRARAEDDFGLTELAYTIEAGAGSASTSSAGATATTRRVLESTPLDVAALQAAQQRRGSPVRAAALARARVDVAQLAPNLAEGQQFQLQVLALDNAQPQAKEGRAAPLRVRVVSDDEFLRRVQDRLSRAQVSTQALAQLAREKLTRTRDLASALQSDAPDASSVGGDVAAELTGQRRVQGDARSLARELTAAAEAVLYARVDERALAALERLDAALAATEVRGFDPAPWRELAEASSAEQIAGGGLAGKLIDIAGIALAISEDLSAASELELRRAQEALDAREIHAHLVLSATAQQATLERIELLLEKLAEWDNFQSVLSLTRDILNGQKSLSERTRQTAQEK